MKRTRFAALLAATATAFTLSACSHDNATTADATTSPASAASQPTAAASSSAAESGKNDDAAAAAAGACGAAHLAATFEAGSAAGTHVLTLTNSSQTACTLHPDVEIELKDAAGDGVSENLKLSSQAGSIAPGSSVSWTVALADAGSVPGCAPVKPATHLEVDIEDGGEDIDIPVNLTGCQDDDIDLLSEVR
ncbi:MAG: DUF4232 domain-containing protein [Actinotignum sanguinis]|uniref:DUF4232 domain-containing protein n=1 Tax=Actinotignum TaxID=1653174 RepID=UPI00237E513F|nr:DUF4232 domain-containing protein [Actinotignum sanguinis]MDE1553051.1 DUF4232 domain-containing protein [Actinotignum sanguinis]MDE1565173.1 DUF4232 domain-containing protein [Actinotignum sanguinis]MDE1577746.1 DUF4232 domain-containing protein [Actinotignum sanguinis]MDE1642086.1 DUF4232 domain-containing protein [Actinotignum sanguinis]MDK8286220.1 DUF4232 domain-containing protein [Actinotignum sanguinis]